MADATADDIPVKEKSSKMPLIIGLVLALAGGGGGFFAAQSGLIPGTESGGGEKNVEPEKDEVAEPTVAFIPMDQLTISLPSHSTNRYLRFRGELEVSKKYTDEVEQLMPRVVDVLNTYLRAVELSDLEEAAALNKLRAQMLRRVQIVVGPGRVSDLLVMEFVLQ
ncbi:flagellar basal body-associated FliL family protein [uncultured Roseobacter sp.]|uniref:flagellar basal body-associated FliL family protein n=1 Tax=uncultured Roseobacter sp. TaxID=114847 RepID=UPI00261B935D|nr:flagellar basal body-associated FliL family protein [uncultured Roseobacter sp.]